MNQEQSTELVKEFTIYRGQKIASEEFKQLLRAKGGLLSFNTFLSTNKEKRVAIESAQRSLTSKDDIAVLFVMNIDGDKTSSSNIPYATIDK